jgi:hypothetical protein
MTRRPLLSVDTAAGCVTVTGAQLIGAVLAAAAASLGAVMAAILAGLAVAP